MKAISVRAPWWWAILYCGKDIENRDWPTRFMGRVLLHASNWWKIDEVQDDMDDVRLIRQRSNHQPPINPPETTWRGIRDMGGHIVGSVEIVDCISQSISPWFFGKYGFVLRDPVAFDKPVPFKGALGFFDVPDELIEHLTAPNRREGNGR